MKSATEQQKAPEQTPEQKQQEAEAVAYSELLELAQRKFVHQIEQAITTHISSVAVREADMTYVRCRDCTHLPASGLLRSN